MKKAGALVGVLSILVGVAWSMRPFWMGHAEARAARPRSDDEELP